MSKGDFATYDTSRDLAEEINLLAIACLIDSKARDAIRLTVALAGEYAADTEEQWTAVAQTILDEDYRRAIRWIRRLSGYYGW